MLRLGQWLPTVRGNEGCSRPPSPRQQRPPTVPPVDEAVVARQAAPAIDAEFVVANVSDAPTTLRGRTFDRVYPGGARPPGWRNPPELPQIPLSFSLLTQKPLTS